MVEGGIAIEGGRGCAGSIEGVMEGRGSAEWEKIIVGVPSGGRSLGECRVITGRVPSGGRSLGECRVGGDHWESAEWGEITGRVPSGERSLGECREVY